MHSEVGGKSTTGGRRSLKAAVTAISSCCRVLSRQRGAVPEDHMEKMESFWVLVPTIIHIQKVSYNRVRYF